MADDPVLSALVVLRPRTGDLSGFEAITSETVGARLPAPSDVQRAVSWCTGAGFRVEPVVGLSFSIVGPRWRFEQVFGTRLEAAEGRASVGGVLELPLGALPPDVASVIQAVAFTPPPDFGPTSY